MPSLFCTFQRFHSTTGQGPRPTQQGLLSYPAHRKGVGRESAGVTKLSHAPVCGCSGWHPLTAAPSCPGTEVPINPSGRILDKPTHPSKRAFCTCFYIHKYLLGENELKRESPRRKAAPPEYKHQGILRQRLAGTFARKTPPQARGHSSSPRRGSRAGAGQRPTRPLQNNPFIQNLLIAPENSLSSQSKPSDGPQALEEC